MSEHPLVAENGPSQLPEQLQLYTQCVHCTIGAVYIPKQVFNITLKVGVRKMSEEHGAEYLQAFLSLEEREGSRVGVPGTAVFLRVEELGVKLCLLVR